MDGHRCGSKEIYNSRDGKSKSKRKQWATGGGQKTCLQEMGRHASGHKHPHLEVDIAFDNNLKQNSYDCGSESHRHLYLEGDMAFDGKQGMDDHYCGSEHSHLGSEDYKHSHSDKVDKASGKKGKQFG